MLTARLSRFPRPSLLPSLPPKQATRALCVLPVASSLSQLPEPVLAVGQARWGDTVSPPLALIL